MISTQLKNGLLEDINKMVEKLQFMPDSGNKRVDRFLFEARASLECAQEELKELDSEDEE